MSASPSYSARRRVIAAGPARLDAVASPTRLLLAIGGTLVLVLLALPLDSAFGAWLRDWAGPTTAVNRVLRLSNHLFRWWTVVGLIGLLLLQPQRMRLMVSGGGALVLCLTATHLCKFIVGRARPDSAAGLLYGPFYFQALGDPRAGLDSFPSGHAALTVLLLLLLRAYLPRTFPFLVLPAVLACLSRVALARHYLSDVVAGAGLAVCAFHMATWRLGSAGFVPLDLSGLREQLKGALCRVAGRLALRPSRSPAAPVRPVPAAPRRG